MKKGQKKEKITAEEIYNLIKNGNLSKEKAIEIIEKFSGRFQGQGVARFDVYKEDSKYFLSINTRLIEVFKENEKDKLQSYLIKKLHNRSRNCKMTLTLCGDLLK